MVSSSRDAKAAVVSSSNGLWTPLPCIQCDHFRNSVRAWLHWYTDGGQMDICPLVMASVTSLGWFPYMGGEGKPEGCQVFLCDDPIFEECDLHPPAMMTFPLCWRAVCSHGVTTHKWHWLLLPSPLISSVTRLPMWPHHSSVHFYK